MPITLELHGRETLLTIDRARNVLGCEPAHRWPDHVAET